MWAGCMYRSLEGELEAIVRLLRILGFDFDVYGEFCCGYPYHVMGDWGRAREIVEANISRINGYDMVVTPCPTCQIMLSTIYGEYGLEVRARVRHTVSLICERAGSIGPLRGGVKVMYHDPCKLSRNLGIYREPRSLLESIPVKLYKQRFTGVETACCGAGGLLMAFSPTLSLKIAVRKLRDEDSIPSDVDYIVTECPACIENLRRAASTLGLKAKVTSLAGLILDLKGMRVGGTV